MKLIRDIFRAFADVRFPRSTRRQAVVRTITVPSPRGNPCMVATLQHDHSSQQALAIASAQDDPSPCYFMHIH